MMDTKEPYTPFTTSASLKFQTTKLKMSIVASSNPPPHPWRMLSVLVYEMRWSELVPGLTLLSGVS